MASQCTFFSKILAIVIMINLILSYSASAECQLARPSLVAQCGQFLKTEGPKVPPSVGCCSALKDVDVPCLCDLTTPETKKLVSMEKAIYVARTCGVKVQPNLKCGNLQAANRENKNILEEFPTFIEARLDDSESFDCVNIYEQISLQQPRLKNHKIQMKPSFAMDGGNQSGDNDLEGRGCPEGMVPIAKTKSQITDPSEFQSIELPNHTFSKSFPGQHFAVLRTRDDGTIYKGASAKISINSPSVRYPQYSKAQIWLESGQGGQLNSLHIGWAVHPRIYGDTRPRFTIFWTGDGYRTGCYNVVCPGFVQVHRSIHPGAPFQYISIIGGHQYAGYFKIMQDPTTHNWLVYETPGTLIGYWPKELLPSLQNGASLVRFGGNTFGSPDGDDPPMGNGHYAGGKLGDSGVFANVKYAKDDYEEVDIERSKMFPYMDVSSCYTIRYQPLAPPELGKVFFYGGPGGKRCGI